jgi:hypothetical protein
VNAWRTPLDRLLGQANLLVTSCILVALCLAISSAFAAEPQATGDAQAVHKSEVAVCASGASRQGRETCMREAEAAYAQNRRGALADRQADYQRNVNQRCDALQGSERTACVARMSGQGSTSGSVADGGVYRELTTRSTPGVPGSTAQAASTPYPASAPASSPPRPDQIRR